jgi:hypothetical protein
VVMLKMGFNSQCVAKIMQCVTTVSFTVLLNGSKLQGFQPSRGIRLGNPISPYLFLLAAEGLSCLLKARSMNDQVKDMVVAPGAPLVYYF